MTKKKHSKKTNAINAVSSTVRHVDKVRRHLIDIKSKAKKKAASIRAERLKTGGGPPSDLSLTLTEEILVDMMNPQTIEGIITDGDTETSTISFGNFDFAKPVPLAVVSLDSR